MFIEPILDAGMALTGLVLIVGLAIALPNTPAKDRIMQVNDWEKWFHAVGVALVVWAIISLIRAPFSVIDKDRKSGQWRGARKVYNEPLLIAVSIWTDKDRDKVAHISFDDVEENSLVDYDIRLDPPVGHLASAYLEQSPNQLSSILGSIKSVSREGMVKVAKLGGSGSTRLIGKRAFLRVQLEPNTVPVTARVYLRGFDISVQKKRTISE